MFDLMFFLFIYSVFGLTIFLFVYSMFDLITVVL